MKKKENPKGNVGQWIKKWNNSSLLQKSLIVGILLGLIHLIVVFAKVPLLFFLFGIVSFVAYPLAKYLYFYVFPLDFILLAILFIVQWIIFSAVYLYLLKLLKNRHNTLLLVIMVLVSFLVHISLTPYIGGINHYLCLDKENYLDTNVNEMAGYYLPTVKTGVYGRVLIQPIPMPSSLGSGVLFYVPDCGKEGVGTEIYFREVLKEEVPGLTSSVNKSLIKIVKSTKKGFYEAELLPGNYSVFVFYGGKEYCNSWNKDFERCVIQVKEDQVTYYQALIN